MMTGEPSRRWARAAAGVVTLGLAACAGGGGSAAENPTRTPTFDPSTLVPSGPPTGEAILPDLSPEPPDVLQTGRGDEGSWSIRFTSVLVNVGEGDLALKGERVGDEWQVEQVVSYSDGGAEHVPIDAVMAWGGDGHGHWHVARIVTYLLEPAQEPRPTAPGTAGRPDAKIGFCFYDSGKELDRGPDEPRFRGAGCGKEESETFLMGLTPGWGDTYDFMLPGQSIDVTDLPDGDYRLWAQADPQGWFHEVTRDNNVTWVDMELLTLESGSRAARVVEVGPRPQ